MIKRCILLFALFIGVTFSRSVTFKVLGFGSKVTVKINNKKYNLKNTEGEPYFSGKLTAAPEGDFTYSYALDNESEPFERLCLANQTETYIDFFGREETIKPLGQFQYPDNHWTRSIGKTNLFDDSYIPTIHFYGNTTETFFHKPSSSSTKMERVTFYLKDTKKAFTNVPVTAKNKSFEKFQIKMTLSKKSNINQRYLLKFRNGSEDPINLRQTIYGNINQAIGIPSIHSVMVRVYYNMKPVGFYTMQEEAVSESFLRAEFYGDAATETIDPPSPFGDAFDCSTGGDFEYKPYNMSYYDPLSQKIGTDKSKVIAMTEALEKLDTTNEQELEEFDKKWFDIESFHKAMAMEYLTGDWDGYWFFTSNFVIFEDAKASTDSTYKFFYITQDHDETFGVGISPPVNTVGYDFPKISYTTMLNKTWHYDEFDAEHRTLVDRFIASTPQLQQRFQDTLISIVQNIFNPVAFKKVVETYFERYQPEAEWDYSFERPYTRTSMVPDWRYKDFLAGFNSSLPGLPWGLYEWVTLRAEALKQEFCITWEGDENPPDESCVPYSPFPPEEEKATTTTEIPEETTTTEVPEETTTTEVPKEETTTTVEETTSTEAPKEETTTTVEETTSTEAPKEETTTPVEETTTEETTTEETTVTEYDTTTIEVTSTETIFTTDITETHAGEEEPTTTEESTTITITRTTTANEPTPTTKSTKSLPTTRGGFVDWFKDKKPSDLSKRSTLQIM